MNRATTETHIQQLGDAVDHTFTEDQLNLIVARGYLTDVEGRNPGTTGYVETVELPRAMVAACDFLLIKHAALTDVNADGVSIASSQLIENLRRIRGTYLTRCLPLWETP